MSKTKAVAKVAADENEDVAEKGAYRIVYTDGDEVYDLSFHDCERRDHEASRLRQSGILLEKVNPEE